MIKIIEKNFLNDCFINKAFAYNIDLNEKLIFNKNDIYYFGNYDLNKINLIKDKLIKNKKNIMNAVEKGCKFIISGNSINLFNNNFNIKELNLFTFCTNDSNIHIYDKKIKHLNNLNKGIYGDNFKYKNLICIKNIKYIDKIIKMAK